MEPALPLKVILKGFSERDFQYSSSINRIHAGVDEPSGRLPQFVRSIWNHMSLNGYSQHKYFKDRPSSWLEKGGALLLNSKTLNKKQRTIIIDGTVRKSDFIEFDARNFLEKYQDFEWAKEITIEKLSLCKEGRLATFAGPHNKKLIDEEYEEIASIPLPTED
ncbi:MAG: hypothetical protein Q9166_005443 [cf. Caloplaca sp. 2 TL-2023]